MKIAILGLGEAGSRFANDLNQAAGVTVSGWDPDPRYRLEHGVRLAGSNAEAAAGAAIVFSVNWPEVSEAVAAEVAPVLAPGAFYCEMNTSAPAMKESIAAIIERGGRGKMIDVAIMAPVPPKGILTPMLAAGAAAPMLIETASAWMNIEYLNDTVGTAAGRKLLRSIVYKGVAAVICEAMAAGEKLHLEPYIREQIRSIIGDDNDALIERFIEGSRTHARRRMHEMEAVTQMLQANGLSAIMSQAAVRHLGSYLDAEN